MLVTLLAQKRRTGSSSLLSGVRPQTVNIRGELEPMKPLRAHREILRPMSYHRVTPLEPVRGHRRQPAFGLDRWEQRAQQNIDAPITERIVYKLLVELVGKENFVWQFDILGGRQVFKSVFTTGTLIGGFIIDFVILDREPPLALEVMGAYWHGSGGGPERDMARKVAVNQFGFDYKEVHEADIMGDGTHLENVLVQVLGGRRGGMQVDLARRLPPVVAYYP